MDFKSLSRRSSQASSRSIAKGLLFFSGLAALVYQTIWIKQLMLVV